MSDYEKRSKAIRREIETEQRVRLMDAHEIVAEIIALEDARRCLEEALEAMTHEYRYELGNEHQKEAWTNARAAIAKARGEE